MSDAQGPLSTAELEAAIKARLPSGVETPAEQFSREFVLWAKHWLRVNQNRLETDDARRPFVVIFSTSATLDAQAWVQVHPESPEIVRYRKEAYDIPKSGILYATANLSEIYRVGPPFADGSSAIEAMLAADYVPLHYAIFFPDQRSIAFHLPNDTNADFASLEARQLLEGYSIANLSIEMLDDLLKKFHVQVVKSSTCYAGVSLWESAKDRKMVEQAERVVQGHLATFLYGKFDTQGVHTDWEVVTPGGRTDIRLLRLRPGGTTTTTAAYLELKVVRYTKSDKEALEWVEDGIKQARDYMDGQVPASELGLACCYNNHDKGTAIQSAAQPLADRLKVYLRFYELQHVPPHSQKGQASATTQGAAF